MTETKSGKDRVREAVASRASVMAIMARDCGVSIDLLYSFAHGRADLPAKNLDLVVKFIWNDHIEYNAVADALQPREQPPHARLASVRP